MDETSPGGSRIYRHDTPVTGGSGHVAHVEPDVGESILAHYDKHFKTEPVVFHELVSDLIHLDVYIYPPADVPHIVAATVGMSALPMNTPDRFADRKWAEVMIALPADWPLNEESSRNERHYWPIRWLKNVARIPHTFDSWVGNFHTVPNGDPAKKIANTNFRGICLLPPVSFGEGCGTIEQTDRGRTTQLLSLVPLHGDEMQYKLDHGIDALLPLFDEHNVNDLLEPDRSSVLPRKGLKGLLRR